MVSDGVVSLEQRAWILGWLSLDVTIGIRSVWKSMSFDVGPPFESVLRWSELSCKFDRKIWEKSGTKQAMMPSQQLYTTVKTVRCYIGKQRRRASLLGV